MRGEHQERLSGAGGVCVGARLLLVFLISLSIAGCARESTDNPLSTASGEAWQYAIRPGMSRLTVHQMLGEGGATRRSDELEEYPLSGVTVWFGEGNRVTKVGFEGAASAIYTNPGSADVIPSDQPLIFGLTGHSDAADFRKVLGIPTREVPEGPTATKEMHCIWKRSGYVVDALFLKVERATPTQTYVAGSLLWFEVYRGL